MGYFDRSKYILNIQRPAYEEDEQATTQQPVNNQGRIADSVDMLQMGALKGTAGVIDMAGTLTGSDFVKSVAQKFYGWGDNQMDQLSDRGRTAMQQQIFEQGEDGSFSLGEGATNFDTWLLNIANGLGQFAPIIAGGGGAGLAARALGATQGVQKAVSTAGFIGSGGAMATGMGGNEARSEVKGMPQEVLDAAPIYQELLQGIKAKKPDLNEQEAKDRARTALAEQLAKEAMTDPKALLANFAMSAISDPILGRALMGARLGKGFLGSSSKKTPAEPLSFSGSVGKGALVEAPTEFVQGGTQALVNNEVLSQIDGRDIWDGVLVGAANEAVIGGAVGGTVGAITYPFGSEQQDQPPPPGNTGSVIGPGNTKNVSGGDINLPPEMEAELNRTGSDPTVDAVAAVNPLLGAELDGMNKTAEARTKQLQQALQQGPVVNTQPAQVGAEYWQSSGGLLSEFMPPAQTGTQATAQSPATDTLNDARQVLTDSLVEQALSDEISLATTDVTPVTSNVTPSEEANSQPATAQTDLSDMPNIDGVFVKLSNGEPFKGANGALASATAKELTKRGYEFEAVEVSKGKVGLRVINNQVDGTNVVKSNSEQDRADGSTSTVSDKGLTLIHGSPRSDIKLNDLQIIRSDQKQAKKGRTYGGFYATSESDIEQAKGYSKMGQGTPTIYDVSVKPGTKVLQKEGDITRLTENYINELVSQGYGLVVGKDPRGRTEYVVIDKNAISDLKTRVDTATNTNARATLSDQAAVTPSPETVTAPSNAQEAQAMPAITGKKATVSTPNNSMNVDTSYRIVEADSLVTSNDFAGAANPNYPAELQPRDRSRQSYQIQVNNIANNPKAELLADSPTSDRGAPIVRNGVVESGNGRSIGMREAYRTGKAEQYRQAVINQAQALGMDPAAVNSMKQPVLVRERLTDLSPDELRRFTQDSNRSAGVDQSPVELARADAELIDNDLMDRLSLEDNEDFLSESNRSFVNGFAAKLGNNEAAAYTTGNGQWNKAFKDRIQNAIFAKGFDDLDLLAEISESADAQSKNLLNSLMNVSAKLGATKAADPESGKITADTVTQAARMLITAKRNGTIVSQVNAQTDMLSAPAESHVTQLAQALESNYRSGKKMTALLDGVVSQMLTGAQNAGSTDLFSSEPAGKPNINEAINNVTGQQATTTSNTTGSQNSAAGNQVRQGNTTEQSGVPEDTGTRQSESGSGGVSPEIQAAAEVAFNKALDNEFENVTSKDPGLYLFDQFQIDNPQLAMRIINGSKYDKDEFIGQLAEAAGFTNTSRVPGLLDSLARDPDAWAKSFLAYHNGKLDNGKVSIPVKSPQTNQPPANDGVFVSDDAESKLDQDTDADKETDQQSRERNKQAKLQDSGEALFANKKRLFAEKGITWSDVKGENETLRVSLAVKQKSWPRPNWEAIVNSVPESEQEAFTVIVHMVKQVYDAISTKPSNKTDASIEAYFNAVNTVREAAEALLGDTEAQANLWDAIAASAARTTNPNGGSALDALFAKVFPTIANRGKWENAPEETARYRQLGEKAFEAMKFKASASYDAIKAIKKGWPAKKEAWQVQGYAVAEIDDNILGEVGQVNSKDGIVYSPRIAMVRKDNGRNARTFLGIQPTKAEAQSLVDAFIKENSKPFILVDKRGNFVSAHDTREQAIEAARTATKREGTTRVKEEPLQASEVRRNGVERRTDNRDVTTDELRDAFGFKGVALGNWLTASERQWFTNMAYDSFYDLAETLGLPPKAMSLNGMLGIAFGAQGNAGAAAHFVPGVNEINLTKKNGAGALAHEWGHAVDHYFATVAGAGASDTPFASAIDSMPYRNRESIKGRIDQPDGIRKVIYDAFIALSASLKQKLETRESYDARIKQNLDSSKANFDDYVSKFEAKLTPDNKAKLQALRDGKGSDYVNIPPGKGKRKSPGAAFKEVLEITQSLPDLFTSADEILVFNRKASSLDYAISAVGKEPALQKIHTAFYSASKNMDKSKPGADYWQTPHEMFARAFESYVMDRMAEKGQINDFLVRPDKRDPGDASDDFVYPAGVERSEFNSLFDTLIGEIETKETDSGVMMFSKSKAGADISFSNANRNMAKTRIPRGVPVAVAEREANAFMQSLNGAAGIKVVVLPTQADAEKLWRMQLDGDFVRGAYSDKTGTVYVIAENVRNMADLKQTIAHEVIAHGGLDKLIGQEQKAAFLKRISDTRGKKDFAKAWAQIDRDYDGMSEDVKAEELFAYFVQDKPQRGPVAMWFNALVRWLNNQLAKVGLTKASNPDMDLMRDMMDSIVQGFKTGRTAGSRGGMYAGEMAFSNKNSFVITDQEAIEQGYDVDNSFYSGTYGDPVSGIQRGMDGPMTNNIFDGIFAGDKGVAESHGDTVQRFVIKTEVANNSDLDSDDSLPILKELIDTDNLTDDEFTIVADAVIYDRNLAFDSDYEGLLGKFMSFTDPGEQSWEMQRIRGQLARKLGFDAVKMNDEHGTSFLLVGDGVKRIADKSEMAFSKDSENFAPATVNTDANTALPADFVALLNDAVNTANDQSPEPLTVNEFKGIIEESFNDAVNFNDLEMDLSFDQALKQAEADGVITFTPTIAGAKRGKANDARKERDRELNERTAVMDALPAELRGRINSLAQELAYLNSELESVNADKSLSQLEKARLKRELQADTDSAQSRYNEARAEAEQTTDLRFSRTSDTRTAKEKLGLADQADETLKEMATARYHETADTLKSSKFWKRLGEGVFDGMSGILNAEVSSGFTDPNKQGYVSARLASGLADVLHGVFHFGAPEWRNGIVARKADTKGLLEVFNALGEDLNSWLAWMGANRAEQLMAEGRENNLTVEDIAELKALAEGKEAKFEEVRKEYNKINSAIIDLAQQAGLISDAQRGGFDEEWYVPFFRNMENEVDPEMQSIAAMVHGPKSRNGIANQNAQLKELKGGKQSTKDLLENIIQRHSTLIDASLKNHAMLEIVGNLSGTDYMQPVTSPDIKALSQTELNLLSKVKVMRDGKAEAYAVSDPALLRGLLQLNNGGNNSLFNRMARSAKRFLTAGITLSPDFIVKNFVRDAAHAWMVNKDEFKFGSDSIKGLRKAFKEDESYRDLIFSGAAFQGGYIHGADPEAAAQQIRRALKSKGLTVNEINSYMDSLVTKGGQLLEKYRNASDKVENANRLVTYEAALKAGKSPRQAAFEAKDLMDYSLKGNFALIGTMIDMLPFFNARLQGMSKLVRAAKAGDNDRVLKVLSANLAMKGIKVAAFSLALAALHGDDERYKELPDWDKDSSWHFWLGDDHIRIPKPFELGIIFGTFPERMLHYGAGNQPASDLAKAVGHAVFNTLALNPIPQFALPIAEMAVNKSFFRGTDIENMSDENRLKEDRYSAYTSDTAKLIGKISGHFGVSPKQVEHLVLGYTGTIGGYVLSISDLIARTMLGTEAADAPISRYPVIKAFYQGSGPKTNTKFQQEFYDAINAANQVYGSYKRAYEEGNTDRQRMLLEKNKDKLGSRIQLNRLQRQVSDLNKQADMVNISNSLNGQQKRERLDEIARRKNALYQAAYVRFNLGEW